MNSSDRHPLARGRLLTLWSLRPGTHLECGEDVVLHHRWGTERLVRPRAVVQEALRRMNFGPVNLANVPGARSGGELDDLVDRLRPLLECSLQFEGGVRPLLSLVTMSPHAEVDVSGGEVGADTPVRLSRFAVLRSTGDGFVMESPLSLYRARLASPEAMALVGMVGRATTPAEVTAGLPLDAVRRVLGLLAAAGLVTVAPGGRPPFEEEQDETLASWTAMDLLFHTRSTLGRHDYDFGAVRRRAGRGGAGSRATMAEGRRVPLPRPVRGGEAAGVAGLMARAGRQREFGAKSPSREQLAELLFHAAPAATGSCCPLELYVSVDDCAGLAPGIYRYDRADVSLVLVNSDAAARGEMQEHARIGAQLARPPAVLITVTARFDRIERELTGPGYALVLRSAGAALHTLRLVAAAARLAAVPLAMLDIDTDARALRLDWRAESSVAALAVGTPAGEGAGTW
ncbi:SagB family peptide dehydrogenase [Streptomyces varsoviensis]|nr:SagB family peptide dehydrogenase [Streptomyces varsoviensis]